MLLEIAVYRDGRTFEEACTVLEQNGRLGVTREELRRIMAELPRRPARRVVEEANPDELIADESTDGSLLDGERAAHVRAATEAVQRAVERLDPEDRLVVRMRFFEGFTIAEVARALGVAQKPLYARLQRILGALGRQLAAEGIRAESLEWLRVESH